MSHPNSYVADTKREEYRKYLEKTGVMDALTKTLAVMNTEPEKPADPLKYMLAVLGHSQTGQPTIDALLSELSENRAEITRLRLENEELRRQMNPEKENDC